MEDRRTDWLGPAQCSAQTTVDGLHAVRLQLRSDSASPNWDNEQWPLATLTIYTSTLHSKLTDEDSTRCSSERLIGGSGRRQSHEPLLADREEVAQRSHLCGEAAREQVEVDRIAKAPRAARIARVRHAGDVALDELEDRQQLARGGLDVERATEWVAQVEAESGSRRARGHQHHEDDAQLEGREGDALNVEGERDEDGAGEASEDHPMDGRVVCQQRRDAPGAVLVQR
eukprot:6703498-Prymnesium_polylepis.1